MQLSQIKRTTIASNVLIDDDCVILFVPSLKRKIWEAIDSIAMLLNNCAGIIVPNKNITINKKIFKGRNFYLDAKKRFGEIKTSKKLNVFGSLSPLDNKHDKKIQQYYIYDLSLLMHSINTLLPIIPEKKVISLFITSLKNQYNSLKNKYPRKKILIVADVYSEYDLSFSFLYNFKELKNKYKDILMGEKFFDSFFFAAVNDKLIPALEFNEEYNSIQPIMQNIHRMKELVLNVDAANDINGAPAISNKTNDSIAISPSPADVIDKIADALSKPDGLFQAEKKSFIQAGLEQDIDPSVLPDIKTPKSKQLTLKAKAKGETIDVGVDSSILTKVLKYYKVTNADIINNVKSALDRYIKETGNVPTVDNAKIIVLKAVHKTVHGTDEISDVYKNKPNLLFEKLKTSDVFSVPLKFPDKQDSFPFNMNEIIDLDSTTALHRQKYEFTELIHEQIKDVFKILKNQKHPIELKSIHYEYKDNSVNRYTEYTLILKNLDGNRAEYPIKLQIPTTINDKYFKLGGNK